MHGPLCVDTVDQGVIPPCVPTTLSGKPYNQWHAGVYDKYGNICVSSLMERSGPERKMSVPFLPTDIDIDNIEHFHDEVVYGGILLNHFGHFLLESTNRLWWPLLNNFAGYIVFQNPDPDDNVGPFASRFFDLVGISDRIIIAKKTLGFDRVIVPQPSLIIQRHVYKEFQIPFLIAGESAEEYSSSLTKLHVVTDAPGLYLSRTRYGLRRSYGEDKIENRFRNEGFSIVSMETLPLEYQILIMKRHKSVVGIMGSAFHTMLFSNKYKNATYICRDFDINTNYFMIDEIMGNNAIYIYNDCLSTQFPARNYWDDTTLNLPKIFEILMKTRILQHD
jgi:capsular polysaccharide biosynthesis protein